MTSESRASALVTDENYTDTDFNECLVPRDHRDEPYGHVVKRRVLDSNPAGPTGNDKHVAGSVMCYSEVTSLIYPAPTSTERISRFHTLVPCARP